MNKICLRAVEFRAAGDAGDGRTLEGYGAVFDAPAHIVGWEGEWDEEIARGAFKKTLRQRQPVLQFDHGRDHRTGSVPIGAIETLTEDDKGLYVKARLFDNDVVEPIRQAIEGQAITGMSFRFEVARDEWRDRDGKKIKDDELWKLLWEPGERGPLKRTILEVDPLYELGPVVFPAYDATSVGVRSLLAQVDVDERKLLVKELATELRRAGVDLEAVAENGDNPTDLTGQSDTRSADGGDSDAQPTDGEASTRPSRRRAHHDLVLKQAGVIK
ncbi:HK97 family phage prohead protease [Streptomyces sp.]|uniref:HK97 family phage prohead protease n=1 Tax=Streptomyces sp. TaxID=1931 RepID=UPI002F92C138